MRYIIIERLEMLTREVLKLQKKAVPNLRDLKKIELIQMIIDELQAILDINSKILKDLREKKVNLDKLQMQSLGALIQDHIKGLGFVLFVFPFGPAGISNYISNGHREDIIKLLRETLERFENDQIVDTPTNN